MRIEFDENGYDFLEFKKSEGGISIIISSKSASVPRSSVINSAEVSEEEFLKLLSDLNLKNDSVDD